ncbi:hypothetical protein GMORB2_7647 [Geosmithia morbida]|uniref:Extracellular membrane protein CFEM domain-containing protein n=1 Tax=Geosmithia morbida TaxID=1094350 RepID=A0A9P4YW08_9HYPO|nr:uncharacterized protein GMORB2_7647 [Geosmithia morbida]KAF4122054.1 hypothetical protein GMORB2_7647 [Geosmithia morbida]
MMAPSSISSWAVVLALMGFLGRVEGIENNFDFYPTDAQSCLYKAGKEANCPKQSVSQLNSCQCNNGGDFITLTAECLGTDDSHDLRSVYTIMDEACGDSSTPIGMTRAEFEEAAASASATASATASPTATTTATATATAKATATSSASPSSSPTDLSDGGTLSDLTDSIGTGGVVGVAVGAAAAVAGIAALVSWCCFRRYKKRNGARSGNASNPSDVSLSNSQAHPMLGPGGGAATPGSGYLDPSDANAAYYAGSPAGTVSALSPNQSTNQFPVSPWHASTPPPPQSAAGGAAMAFQHPHEYLQHHHMQQMQMQQMQQMQGPVELPPDNMIHVKQDPVEMPEQGLGNSWKD